MGALARSPGSISEHNGTRHCSIQRYVDSDRSCTSGIWIWGGHLPLRKGKVAQPQVKPLQCTSAPMIPAEVRAAAVSVVRDVLGMEITHKPRSRLRAIATQFLLGIAGLALITFVCFQFGFGLARTGFAYVILVALVSLLGSFSTSVVLSLVAAVCLNYFFAPPLFELRVDSADDIVRIAAFLTTSLVVTALITKRKRAEEDLE